MASEVIWDRTFNTDFSLINPHSAAHWLITDILRDLKFISQAAYQHSCPPNSTMAFAWKASGLTLSCPIHLLTKLANGYSFNRYLAVTARVVRRSLKEQPRLQAERRGEMELRFAKWTVSRGFLRLFACLYSE